MLTEIHHRVSKEASNAFFELGKKWFHELFQHKFQEGILRKTPQFVHIRRQLHKKNVPPINLEVAYRHRETGDVIVLQDLEVAPTTRFPRTTYEKLYEIASVKVYFYKLFSNSFATSFFLQNSSQSQLAIAQKHTYLSTNTPLRLKAKWLGESVRRMFRIGFLFSLFFNL